MAFSDTDENLSARANDVDRPVQNFWFPSGSHEPPTTVDKALVLG